jgi:uncharacterized protein
MLCALICHGNVNYARATGAFKKKASFRVFLGRIGSLLWRLCGIKLVLFKIQFFEIMFDVGGKVRFHLKASNGLIIAASQFYRAIASAEKGIVSTKKNAPMTKIIDHTTSLN